MRRDTLKWWENPSLSSQFQANPKGNTKHSPRSAGVCATQAQRPLGEWYCNHSTGNSRRVCFCLQGSGSGDDGVLGAQSCLRTHRRASAGVRTCDDTLFWMGFCTEKDISTKPWYIAKEKFESGRSPRQHAQCVPSAYLY